MHAGPSRPAFSETFAARASALRTAIPDLTNDQILTEMMRLIALLGDGHSAIYGPAPQQDSPVEFTAGLLPYKFYWFPDGLYIVDGIGEAAKDAGQRVVRFGGFTAEDVLARLSAYRGGDNSMTWRWMGPQFYVGSLLLLKDAGATASRETVDMTLEAPDGRVITRTVTAGRFDIPRKLRPYPRSRARPLYLSRVDTNYWLEELPEHRALYFQFNQVRDAETESLATFADRLRRTLAERRIESLIVDVRHNNGGNNSLVRPLVRAMVDFEMADRQRRVFVIMGRNTFSAAQNFLNEMERWTDATFVGEPSSSSPNFVGEETNVLLPYSRVMGSISTQ
jgi:hypothetical protein